MLKAPWLLFNLLGILVLVVSVSQAVPENKLSEVNGEEGVIDRLEAYLLQQQHQQQPNHFRQQAAKLQPAEELLGDQTNSQRVVGNLLKAGSHRPALDAASAAKPGQEELKRHGNGNHLKNAEKIEFGVGPSDPRYFAPAEDDSDVNNNNNLPRVNNLHTRSGPLRNPYYSNSNYRFDANSRDDLPGLNNYFQSEGSDSDFDAAIERQRLLYGPEDAARFDAVSQDDTLRYPSQYGGNLDIAPSLRNVNEGDDPRGYGASFDASDDLTKAIWERIAELRGEGGGQDTREFLQQVAEAVQRGDKDVARRMLGIRATSQLESVHYLHPKQKQRELSPNTVPNVGPTPDEDQPQEPSKTDYNPNDPSSNINIDTVLPANKSEAALGTRLLAAHPQHLGQSRHSAHLSRGSVSPDQDNSFSDVYFTAMVAGCTAAAVCAIIGTGVCWYKLNKNHRAAKDAEYPAYGVTGPSRDLSPGSGGSGGDRTLAHSAHMYHYQQQKNQMIAIDKSGAGDGGAGAGGGVSDADSEEEEGEDRDYTVYECPGLAPMGEMVVPNPMYPPEDNTPASPSLKEELEHAADRN